jgi:hypothetical protein
MCTYFIKSCTSSQREKPIFIRNFTTEEDALIADICKALAHAKDCDGTVEGQGVCLLINEYS